MQIYYVLPLVLLLLLELKVFVKSENCDKYGVLLYEDIACQPVKDDGKECPTKYDCDFARPKSGCNFKGKTYGPGEDIKSDLTYSACSIGCSCQDFNLIRCAVLDCPEHLGGPRDPNCYNQYDLGQCCSTGKACNITAEAKKCEVDGQKYDIGQQFYPKNTCYTCVCHENFAGKYDEKTCVRQNCVAQIRHSDEINQKCAPAYFNFHSEESLCCPDDFLCPEPTDNIKTINRSADEKSTLECEYGDKKLKLGEGFERKVNKYGKDRNLQCECVLPPLITCKEV